MAATTILLTGRIGNGKSSTANSILGKKVFKTRTSNVSQAIEILKETLNSNGRDIIVVDGVDIEVESSKLESNNKLSKEALEKCDGVVTAFVLVLKYGERFTREEKEAVDVIRSNFGDNVLKSNGVIVISHGDNFDMDMEGEEGRSFKDWCDEQRGVVKDLFEECGSRIVLFNNKTKDLEVQTQQREKLMDKINEISQPYTASGFQEMNREQRKSSEEKELPEKDDKLESTDDVVFDQTEKSDCLPANVREVDAKKFRKDSETDDQKNKIEQTVDEKHSGRNQVECNRQQAVEQCDEKVGGVNQLLITTRTQNAVDQQGKSITTEKETIAQKTSENVNVECPTDTEKNYAIFPREKDKDVPKDLNKHGQVIQLQDQGKRVERDRKQKQTEYHADEALPDRAQNSHGAVSCTDVKSFCTSASNTKTHEIDPVDDYHKKGIDVELSQHQTQHQEHKTHSGPDKNELTQVQVTDESMRKTTLLLIGRTGNGKSATGNSILGKKVFKPRSGNVSGPKEILKETLNSNGRDIIVVDGVDIEDESSKLESNNKLSKAALEKCDGVVTAFVLVLKYGVRFTRQEKEAVSVIRSIFGDNVLKKNGVVVISHGDNFDLDMEDEEGRSFKDWCDEQRGVVKDLFEECGSRIVLFNNKTKDLKVQTQQCEQLMEKVSELKQSYTTAVTEQVKSERGDPHCGSQRDNCTDLTKAVNVHLDVYSDVKKHNQDLKTDKQGIAISMERSSRHNPKEQQGDQGQFESNEMDSWVIISESECRE